MGRLLPCTAQGSNYLEDYTSYIPEEYVSFYLCPTHQIICVHVCLVSASLVFLEGKYKLGVFCVFFFFWMLLIFIPSFSLALG